jgi:hypothetical protein
MLWTRTCPSWRTAARTDQKAAELYRLVADSLPLSSWRGFLLGDAFFSTSAETFKRNTIAISSHGANPASVTSFIGTCS